MTIGKFLKRWFGAHEDEARGAELALYKGTTARCYVCDHVWTPAATWPLTCPACGLKQADENHHGWVGQATCAICSHTWVAIVLLPRGYDHPILPMECPGCGSVAGWPL
jgi:hypothetical protein